MGEKIIGLTDYKGFFGSKWDANPYNSGFDKNLLSKYFEEKGFRIEYVSFVDIMSQKQIYGSPIIYTSSEDIGYHYKDFIEDIICYLELIGAKVIPAFKYLRANNNKVFMELLRTTFDTEILNNINSKVFGTFEELETRVNEIINYPVVVKTAQGAMSRGVTLAKSESELINKVKRITRSKYLKKDIKDSLRPLKHEGYKKN